MSPVWWKTDKTNFSQLFPTERVRMVQYRIHETAGNKETGNRHRPDGRSKHGGISLTFLACLLFLSTPAMAAKPQSPLKANCNTISSAGDVYKVECVVSAVSGNKPISLNLLPFKSGTVELIGVTPPDGGSTGSWILTIRFAKKHPASILFEASYPRGGKMRIGAVYNPFADISAPKKPKRGVVKLRPGGGAVQEFPSE